MIRQPRTGGGVDRDPALPMADPADHGVLLDRHVRGPRRNKAALIWEGEPGDKRTLTYWDLYREVSKFANDVLG